MNTSITPNEQKVTRFSIDRVRRDMNRPRRSSLAFWIRVRIYDGDPLKPKIRISIPLPVLFCLSIMLDPIAAVVLYFVAKKKNLPLLKEIGKGFFLTRLSYMLMRHGRRLGICAIDGNSGVILYGA